MFKYAKKREVLWPVTIDVPSSDGSGLINPVEVKVRYLLLSQTELAEWIRSDVDAIKQLSDEATAPSVTSAEHVAEITRKLGDRIRGWEDIVGEDRQPLSFDDDSLAALLDVPYVRTAFSRGLLQASRGAAAKNSLPGSDGSLKPTGSVPGTAN